MECRYCLAWNEDDEHRCRHCGRRLRPSAARPAADTYAINTSPAPALEQLYEPAAEAVAAAAAKASPRTDARVSYQRSLFREAPQVIPLPNPAPARAAERRASTQKPATQKPARQPRPGRRVSEDQQSLDFFVPTPRTSRSPVEAAIYCDAPVALKTHRMMAAALDWSLIVVAMALFLVTFQVFGGNVVLDRHTLPLFGGILLVFSLFYQFLFCISGGDTAGMRWTQLRLLNFDGQAPNREQRVYRMVGSWVSLLAAGLGMVWALIDEESLTWHDRMSKTFPSPYQPE
jgi:uncharacterized RDD family membrane protein YckC